MEVVRKKEWFAAAHPQDEMLFAPNPACSTYSLRSSFLTRDKQTSSSFFGGGRQDVSRESL